MRGKNNKYLKYFLIIFLMLLVVDGAYFLYRKNTRLASIPKVNNLLDDKNNNKNKNEKEKPQIYENHLPEYRSQYNNNNIYGKLEIPNIKIDTLVTRASNNEFYLNNNLYNQRDGLGVPFFDYRNSDLNTAKQINIYGHNTPNPDYYDVLPFVKLEGYVDRNNFDKYKDVYLSIDERVRTYEVVAIKILTDGNSEHMKVNFTSDEDFLGHVSRLLDNSLYKNNDLIINKDDNLLVLQVCYYDPVGSFLLVICREK